MDNGTAQAVRLGRRMILLGWLAQNAMTGFAFGSFGTLVLAFERDLGVSRSMSTLGIPLMLIAMALCAPVIGILAQRSSLRLLMMAGAALSAIGYTLIGLAPHFWIVLAGYGLFVGPGAAMLGSMVPSALMSNWFDAGRGRAIGIVNMPILVGVVPLASSWLITHHGRGAVFAMMAIGMSLLVPVMALVIDHPRKRGLLPVGATPAAADAPPLPLLDYAAMARKPVFWGIVLMGCVLGGAGVTMVSHIVPLAVGRGFDISRAALLLTAIGMLGAVGSPVFGWLADRLGGVAALTLNGALQALLWSVILTAPSFPVTLGIVALIGIGAGGLMAALGSTFSERFGPQNFGRAYGLFAFVNLPFSVGMPMMAALSFDRTGSYAPAFLGVILALGGIALLGFTLVTRETRLRRALAPA